VAVAQAADPGPRVWTAGLVAGLRGKGEIPGLFRNLPQPALTAVVITASLSLADIPSRRLNAAGNRRNHPREGDDIP
jgi:hypothetical protein